MPSIYSESLPALLQPGIALKCGEDITLWGVSQPRMSNKNSSIQPSTLISKIASQRIMIDIVHIYILMQRTYIHGYCVKQTKGRTLIGNRVIRRVSWSQKAKRNATRKRCNKTGRRHQLRASLVLHSTCPSLFFRMAHTCCPAANRDGPWEGRGPG